MKRLFIAIGVMVFICIVLGLFAIFSKDEQALTELSIIIPIILIVTFIFVFRVISVNIKSKLKK